MSKLTLCGWASCDENYNVTGGKPGDQRNGEEVKCGDWNYFGQTEIYRWKDRELAKEYASILKALCLNDHIGYNQAARWTLNDNMKLLNWDYKKLTKDCDCDCSALVGVAINCLFKTQKVPMAIQTGSMRTYLPLEYFDIITDADICDNDKHLLVGDIINRPYKHVISALEDSNVEDEVVPTVLTAKVVDKTRYIGDTLNASDFIITVIMSNGEKVVNPSEWSAKPLKLTATSNTITITYYNLVTTVVVPAVEKKTPVYRVQVGAYILKPLAENMMEKLKKDGFAGFIVKNGLIYKVQTGAFINKKYAIAMQENLKSLGYSTFIVEA